MGKKDEIHHSMLPVVPEGVVEWFQVRNARIAVRKQLMSIAQELGEQRIRCAKRVNKRVNRAIELVEHLDDVERACDKVDQTKFLE